MKKFFFFFVSICFIFFYQTENIFAQEEQGIFHTSVQYKGQNSQDPNDMSGITEQRVTSLEETMLMNEIKELREKNDRSLLNRILELEDQLEELIPNSVSKPGEYYDGKIMPVHGNSSTFAPELIGNSEIYNSGTAYVSSIATATEQIGTTAGRIWLAFSLRRASVSDTLKFFYSDNNGVSWTYHAWAKLGGTDQINYDQMDMEIIENSSGEKYIWIVYGYRNDGGSGRWRTGGLILQTPTFAGGFYALSWPGDDATKRYYRLRITSDNATFPSAAYVYMVASFDSVSGSNHISTQKTLRCTNPYTVTPTFQYKSDKFYWYGNTNYIADLHSDIAYFRNTSDLIIVSYSNVPDSTKIFFAKSNISNGPATSNGAGGFIGGNQPNDHKQFARLSSNGNNNGSIFCVFRQFTNSRWWVKHFRTTNYGNFNNLYQSILLGSVTSNAYQPEIVGVRNKPKHYYAWRQDGTPDSLRYIGVTSLGAAPQIVNMMNMSSQTVLSGMTGPKPGFRYADNDSCFAVYPLVGPYDVWAAFGCAPGSSVFQLTVNIANGWNMVSIPGLQPVNQNVNNWWAYRDPGANVFRYSGGYQPVTTAAPGIGYWMKHAGALTYNTGDEWPANGINIVPHDPITAAAGWNLFGGYELSVGTAGVTTNPPGLQSGPIYRYSGGYQTANTLNPGYGYWIKLTGAGQIIIPETMSKGEVVEYFPEEWGRIVITDNAGHSYKLYAVSDKSNIDLSTYELPPAPPTGMFDIRFNSGRIAENINSSVKTIDMSGVTYPLTVRVEGMDIRLMDETGKAINVNLKAGEDIVISDATINTLMVSGELIPAQYSLEQNYPNPFNPSTVIEFSLPESVDNVKLTIYSMLGEKVAELVNTSLQAGRYQYQWNAQNVATGMYIYELRTDKFVYVKKMVLMK